MGLYLLQIIVFQHHYNIVFATITSGTVIFIIVPCIIIAKNKNMQTFIINRYFGPLKFIFTPRDNLCC